MTLWPELERNLVDAAGRDVPRAAATRIGAANARDALTRSVAGPGERRAYEPASMRTRRRRRQHIPRRAWAVVAAAAIAACGATLVINKSAQRRLPHDFGALTFASPREIFRLDYQAPYVWRQPGVLLKTVREATAVTVPGLGTLHYWIADNRNHWLCGAIRLPDNSWAGTDNKYEIGGSVPGCRPPQPAFEHLDGWFILGTTIYLHHRQTWNLVYGRASTTGHPVAIRDELTGRTASIIPGGYFAIALPAPSCHLPNACDYIHLSRLVTVNAHNQAIQPARWGH